MLSNNVGRGMGNLQNAPQPTAPDSAAGGGPAQSLRRRAGPGAQDSAPVGVGVGRPPSPPARSISAPRTPRPPPGTPRGKPGREGSAEGSPTSGFCATLAQQRPPDGPSRSPFLRAPLPPRGSAQARRRPRRSSGAGPGRGHARAAREAGPGPGARTSPARGGAGAGAGPGRAVTRRDGRTAPPAAGLRAAGSAPAGGRAGRPQRAGQAGRRGPMLLPLACLHGRVAQCLTALLVLAEPPPRPRRSARAHGAKPRGAEAALPAKMAAELYPPAGAAAATATDIANSNAAAAGRKGPPSAPPPAPPPPAPAPPAPDNNNLESPNWQSFHPTLRER